MLLEEIQEPTQVKVVGENGAVSIVDYPWNIRHKRNMDYLVMKRMIQVHAVDDEDDTTPSQTARRIIRRPSPSDIAGLR